LIPGAVTVSYFFCQSKNHKTLCATALLGSIVGQTLQNPSLNPSLMSFLERTEITPNSCARLEDYVGILLSATPSNWRGIFVLDGLDEMPEEEIDDIFSELKRLREHRRVHLLCSSRPTSACYSIAKSHIDVEWTLSMETADRSDDIRNYITAEISRWNSIRPLPARLERLVEEQLLAGCQGMFLWLSLQIEDICPRYTQELRSDAEILDILGNLPKDLPEAFDKALERMRDGKYGSKLFKLVASAEPPLTIDELRVASNVEPGNTRWDNSKLYSSGKALISAHGGSLLDIDEEDLCVRFIHYSVLLHLTALSSDARTGAFHFDPWEARDMLGAVCTTYLSYTVFENRISTTQKISFGQVPQAAAESIMPSEVSRKAFSFLAKHRRQQDTKVDLERLLYELLNEKWKMRDDVHLFLNYAQDQWLSSTPNIWSDDRHDLLMLWKKLITSPIVSDSLPWETVPEAVAWALSNGHATLFQHYLHSDDRHHLEDTLSAAAAAASTGASNIRLRGEGLGWFAPLYLLYPHYQGPILQAFVGLGCKPFRPNLAKCPSPNLVGSALSKRAGSHIVAALKTYREDRDTDADIIFLASYLDDPNLILDDHSTILQLAIDRGCLSLAFELLSKGANPDGGRSSWHPSALEICLRKKYTSLARRLVELEAELTTILDYELPHLFLAIDDSNLELFNAILRRGGFSEDSRHSPKRETACHRLCAREVDVSSFSAWALKALIDHGANINSRNAAGETPLALAVRTRKPGLTEMLLEHGANPNIGDYDGVRPLHYAQDTEIIQSLLRREADPDPTTVHSHITPLMMAAHQGNAHVVDALLNGGADPLLCISAYVSTKEAFLLSWKAQAMANPTPGTTALSLCSWRLEMELEELERLSLHHRQGYGLQQPAIAHLCSERVSIIIELLKRGVGSDPQYSTLLTWLSDLLSRGPRNNPRLCADLNSALDFITVGHPPKR
jgi:ankyrin repeat protein